MAALPPLTDTIVFALAQTVDDAQTQPSREPSHSDLDFLVKSAGLIEADPKAQGQLVGKAKRVRAILSWAVGHNLPAGQKFTGLLVSFLRAHGGFRSENPNFVGQAAINSARDAFSSEGFALSPDGELSPKVLDALSGAELSQALAAYVRRAQRGADDAALLTGTSKDLLEATAAHVLREVYNLQEPPHQFAALLGQAFVAVGLKTSVDKVVAGEPPQYRLHRSLFDAACAINTLRNRQGTGHGRPWLPSVTAAEAQAAIQTMGLVASLLLNALAARK